MDFRVREIDQDIYKRFKIMAIQQDISVNNLLLRLITEYVKGKGKATRAGYIGPDPAEEEKSIEALSREFNSTGGKK